MLKSYLILAMKLLRRRPFFTFVSLFGISLTLVVLMLATALIDHSFGAMPPEVHANRMLGVFRIELSGGNNHYNGEAGYRLLEVLRGLPGAEEVSLAAIAQSSVSFVDGHKVPLSTRRVDGAFFRVLQFNFIEGGPFTDHDEAEARPVAVISRHTRRRLFGTADALDRHFEVDGQRFRVVGVVENVPAFRPVSAADVWVPISTAKTDAYKRGFMGQFQALILAPSAAERDLLRAEAASRLSAVDISAQGPFETMTPYVETPFEALSREILTRDGEGAGPAPGARMRWLLVVAGLAFMALPSLNLMNLNVSRILERTSEIGIRKSFGASSRTLIGQFLVENVVLTLVGGALSLVLASFVLSLVSGSALVSYAEIGLNLRIFAWGLLLTLVFGVLSGLYPAWRMSRLHPKRALEENPS